MIFAQIKTYIASRRWLSTYELEQLAELIDQIIAERKKSQMSRRLRKGRRNHELCNQRRTDNNLQC